MLVLALLALAAPADDAPQPSAAEEHFARGQEAFAALEYETAAYELMLAATDETATEEQRVRAHLLGGMAHRVLGDDVDARTSFRYVLLQAPETRLPEDTTPKVLLFFESVRQELRAERANAPAAPTPPAPVTPPPPASGSSTGFVIGAVAAAGALACLTGGVAVAAGEVGLQDPDKRFADRETLRAVGLAGLAIAGIGVVGLGAGGLLTLWGEP